MFEIQNELESKALSTFNIQRFASISEVRVGTTNFEVFEDGYRYLGIATIDLPEINLQTIEVSGAGIAGKMDIPVPMPENMELTIHWREISNRFMGLAAYVAHELAFRSAQHLYNASSGNIRQEPVKIVARSIPATISLGKFEPAAETESESKMNVDYLKIWVDGKVQMEFDRFNYIWRVRRNGVLVDYLKGTRQALHLESTAAIQTKEA